MVNFLIVYRGVLQGICNQFSEMIGLKLDIAKAMYAADLTIFSASLLSPQVRKNLLDELKSLELNVFFFGSNNAFAKYHVLNVHVDDDQIFRCKISQPSLLE